MARVPAPEPTRDEVEQAGRMLAWADDFTGNSGLVYGRCDEHDWRGRKRNINGLYRNACDIKWAARMDAARHLVKRHR